MGLTKIAGLTIIVATLFLATGEPRLLCGLEIEYQGFNPIEALQSIQTRQMQEFEKFKETLSQLKFNVLSEDFLAWKQCLSEYEKEKVRFIATAAKIKLTFLSMVQNLTSQRIDANQYQQELEKLLQQFETEFQPAVETFKTNIKNLFETIQDENRRHTWWHSVKNKVSTALDKVSTTVDKVSKTVDSTRTSVFDSSVDKQSGASLFNKIKSVPGGILTGSANVLSKTSTFVKSKLGNGQSVNSTNSNSDSVSGGKDDHWHSQSVRSSSQSVNINTTKDNGISSGDNNYKSISDNQGISQNGKYRSLNQQFNEGYDLSSKRSSIEYESQQQRPDIIRENEFSETTESGTQSNYGFGPKTKEVKKEKSLYISQKGVMTGNYNGNKQLEYTKTRSSLQDTYDATKENSSDITRENEFFKTSGSQSNYDADFKNKGMKQEETSYFGKTGAIENYNENRQFETKTRSGSQDTYGGIEEKSSEIIRGEKMSETSGNQSKYGLESKSTTEMKKEETFTSGKTDAIGNSNENKQFVYVKTRSGLNEIYGGVKEKSLEITREEEVAKTSEGQSNYGEGQNKKVEKEETSYFGKLRNYNNDNRQLEYGKTRSDLENKYGGVKEKDSGCLACPCDCSKTSGNSYRRRRSLRNDNDKTDK
ncbi:hypothetical protein WDU94_012872 [Cyamophila willieti]